MRVACVAGTRPNLVKLAPVLTELERRGAEVVFVDAAQHYDDVLSGQIRRDLALRDPDVVLDTGSGTHAEQTARVMTAFEPLLADLEPAWTLVFGDVNTTLGCALVAAKSPTRLGHVEAGLRSGDRSMPEEVNRRAVDAVSDDHFAPSRDAAARLVAEGTAPDRVHLVGNTMIDSLLRSLEAARERDVPASLRLERGAYAVATLHRPASVDDPVVRQGLLDALGRVAAELPVVLPAHPRLARRLADEAGPLQIVPALGYLDFLGLVDGARLALTDSGGVQEETTVLGVPCLTLRTTTERPITTSAGTNRLVGLDPDQIVAAALEALAAPRPQAPELEGWDGRASERIAEVVVP